jgi:hypothetical protein
MDEPIATPTHSNANRPLVMSFEFAGFIPRPCSRHSNTVRMPSSLPRAFRVGPNRAFYSTSARSSQ